jgi:hypothetical protein
VAAWLGLKFPRDGRRGTDGWWPCHVPWYDDGKPSGSFNLNDGRFSMHGRKPISAYDLAVKMGRFHDWREAVNAFGQAWNVRPRYS